MLDKARVFAAFAIAVLGLMPGLVAAKSKANTPIETLLLRQPWDARMSSLTKTVMFQQAESGGVDATAITKLRLSYFTSSDCTGTGAGSNPGSDPSPSYTTPTGSFTISVGVPFGLVATSAWYIGNSMLSIADMTTIQSLAVTFKSHESNNTPQSNFTATDTTHHSFACIPVTCAAGECTSGSGTQSFTLKTTAAVGDPVDGGVIGCQNTGVSFNLFDIVVAKADTTISTWGGSGTTTNATSATDGAANTTTIVAALGTGSTYAARTCNESSATGGFTSGWFLPSGSVTNSQLNCLYNNRTAIATGAAAAGGAGFFASVYWSSTEANSTNAWYQSFSNGGHTSTSKGLNRRVRCARAF